MGAAAVKHIQYELEAWGVDALEACYVYPNSLSQGSSAEKRWEEAEGPDYPPERLDKAALKLLRDDEPIDNPLVDVAEALLVLKRQKEAQERRSVDECGIQWSSGFEKAHAIGFKLHGLQTEFEQRATVHIPFAYDRSNNLLSVDFKIQDPKGNGELFVDVHMPQFGGRKLGRGDFFDGEKRIYTSLADDPHLSESEKTYLRLATRALLSENYCRRRWYAYADSHLLAREEVVIVSSPIESYYLLARYLGANTPAAERALSGFAKAWRQSVMEETRLEKQIESEEDKDSKNKPKTSKLKGKELKKRKRDSSGKPLNRARQKKEISLDISAFKSTVHDILVEYGLHCNHKKGEARGVPLVKMGKKAVVSSDFVLTERRGDSTRKVYLVAHLLGQGEGLHLQDIFYDGVRCTKEGIDTKGSNGSHDEQGVNEAKEVRRGYHSLLRRAMNLKPDQQEFLRKATQALQKRGFRAMVSKHFYNNSEFQNDRIAFCSSAEELYRTILVPLAKVEVPPLVQFVRYFRQKYEAKREEKSRDPRRRRNRNPERFPKGTAGRAARRYYREGK